MLFKYAGIWATSICMCLFFGCDFDMPAQTSNRSPKYALPVGLNQDPPFTYQAKTLHIYGGDSFETLEDKSIHFVMVEGISTPGSQQPFHQEARTFTRNLRAGGLFEISVIGRDELQREVAHVYGFDKDKNKINLGLSLLKNGLAWFDHSEGNWSKEYRDAEAKAKSENLGIWSKPNPVAPWDQWAEKLNRIRSAGE